MTSNKHSEKIAKKNRGEENEDERRDWRVRNLELLEELFSLVVQELREPLRFEIPFFGIIPS